MKKIDKILIRFVLAFCAIPAFTVSVPMNLCQRTIIRLRERW